MRMQKNSRDVRKEQENQEIPTHYFYILIYTALVLWFFLYNFLHVMHMGTHANGMCTHAIDMGCHVIDMGTHANSISTNVNDMKSHFNSMCAHVKGMGTHGIDIQARRCGAQCVHGA